MTRIAIVTDAWRPQINGVVTTLTNTVDNLIQQGHELLTITPQGFHTIPCPTYPEIPLSLTSSAKIGAILDQFRPNCIHIATEGPLGWAARQICRTRKFPFTTSYHTRFPEYVRLRLPIPVRLSYAVIKAFHRPALRTMVATRPLQQELTSRGFNNLVVWPRGVDTGLFRPRPKDSVDIARPMAMYIGRVAVEKNIEAFLGLDFPKNKYVVGDGPARAGLARKYPEAIFTGYKTGEELAVLAATADVFVFPSRTDTFGVVLLEAMASGVPVAAFPVTGPAETVRNGVNGWLDVDLQHAVRQALLVPSDSCRQFALSRGWASCSRQFYSHLAICHEPFGK